MPYEYNDIVRQFFEELKPLFVNYLRKNFTLGYDDIMDIYSEVWLDVRDSIRNGKVEPGTKWRAYIIKMGWNQANRMATRRLPEDSIDREPDNEDGFNPVKFKMEKKLQEEECKSVYDDPDLKAVLGAELSYIPDPCNKILTMYYFDKFSMQMIADAMNYSSSRSAITTKNRCMDKLRERVRNAVSRLGILG